MLLCFDSFWNLNSPELSALFCPWNIYIFFFFGSSVLLEFSLPSDFVWIFCAFGCMPSFGNKDKAFHTKIWTWVLHLLSVIHIGVAIQWPGWKPDVAFFRIFNWFVLLKGILLNQFCNSFFALSSCMNYHRSSSYLIVWGFGTNGFPYFLI